MPTLLYVTDMRLGDEHDVRRIHKSFPVEALDADIGVDRIAIFIGSGKFAMEITLSSEDVQQRFHQFLNTPAIKSYLLALGAHVQSLPSGDEQTGDMPLLTQMLTWQLPSANVSWEE